MADNFFAQFHEQPVAAAPSGNVNYFSQFHDDAQPGADRPRVIIHTAPQKPDAGVGDAAGRGFGQGVTANFGDEIQALSEVGGGTKGDQRPQSIADSFNAWQGSGLEHIVSGFIKYLAGNPDARKKYDEAVDREREANKAAEASHPYVYGGGQVAGTLATLPIGGEVLGAATLPARMIRGAATGAVVGGFSGAGEGEGATDTAAKAITGAGVGGVVGGAAPAVVEGVIRGGRAAVAPVVNTIRGIRAPEDEAARRTAIALQRDLQADPGATARLTPAEFGASSQSGGPATIMDLGGETTRALARSAANTSPEGRAALNRSINDRFEGQTERVTNWLRNTFNFPNAEAQSQALEQTGRNVNRARYAQAYREGDRPIMSPELDRLMGSPAVVDAMRRASVSGKDRAITQGLGAMRQGVTVENGVVKFTRGPNGAPTYPNLAFWDATKKELDDAASAASRAGRNGEAGVLGDLSRSLRGELDTHVSSYANARAGAAHFFGAQDALEAGQNFVNRNMSATEARQALAQMSPTERQLFQDGFVSKFTDTLNQTGDRRTVLNKIAESPAAREKLEVALGRQRAQELEAGLRVEGIMDLARNAVQGNSTTARQLAELGIAGGVGFGTQGFDTGSIHPSALLSAALVYGAARGHGRINENVSRQVAELLTSQNPQNLIRGIQMIARNGTLFNSLRAADRGLARVGGAQSANIPVLQAAGVSRADDKPNVPRPPGQ